MNKESIKENLINLRNVQTHTWTAMLVTISGSFTLLQDFHKLFNVVFSIAGFLFFLFLLNVYLNREEIINKFTEKLENQ